MTTKSVNRKAVYIDTRLWDKLHKEAVENFDSVTTILKNAVLCYYKLGQFSENNKTTEEPRKPILQANNVDDF